MPHTGLPRESILRKTLTAIPRLAICSIQYLLSPWMGWLSLPDFLLRKKSLGNTTGSSKFRRKKLLSSISIIYGIFCVFMFSSWILPQMGLSDRNLIGSQDVKVTLLDQKIDYSNWGSLISFIHSSKSQIDSSPEEDENDQWNIQLALKRRVNPSSSLKKTQAPLSAISHMSRFNKFHSTSGKQKSEEITPMLFQGTIHPQPDSVTACLFSNQYWLDSAPLFLENWDGPVSLVVECFSNDRADVIRRIEKLRQNDLLVKQRIDFHLVTRADGTRTQRLKNAKRMLINPTATNAQLNLARFFSRSDMVWMVGDARVLSSPGLYKLLSSHIDLRSRVLDYGDAIIIPNFAFNRDKKVHSKKSWWSEGSDLNEFARQYIDETISSISLPVHQWPKTRQDLLVLSTESRIRDSNLTVMTMYDQSWEPQKGPSNWTLWKQFASDVDHGEIMIDDETQSGGPVSIKLKAARDQLYPVVHYDLKYAPNVVVSREGNPWCTERFEYNKAACIYQMYLTGAELWVMPEAWSITVEQIIR